MAQFVSDKDRVVTAGAHTIRFSAGVPRDVPERLIDTVLDVDGITQAKTSAPRAAEPKPEPKPKAEPTIPPRVLTVAKAIRAIIDSEDNEDLLTADGQVRTSVISDEVGFNVSGSLRDKAQALIDKGEV